jgi:hypothetical protein
MSHEKTREVLEQYRATLERQLGRLWAAREAYRLQIEAVDREMVKVREALGNLGTVQTEEPKPEPKIREIKPEEGKH